MIFVALRGKGLGGKMFGDDNCEIACRIEKNLISFDPGNRFEWYRLAVTN
jgi:hypothetical protein